MSKRGGMEMVLAFGLLGLAVLAGAGFLRYSPQDVDFKHVLEGPSALHWLGTDELGRDLLSLTLNGAWTSLLIAVEVQLLGTCLGVLVGLIAGYSRPSVDGALMMLANAMYAFPGLAIVIVMLAVLPPGAAAVVMALSFVSWPLPARVVRGKVMALRSEMFVLAAQAIGASSARVLLRHILPNAISPIVVLLTQGAAAAIIGEAALSYLGIGLPASQPTWGGMIARGRDYFLSSPLPTLVPTLALVVTVVSLYRLGEVLRIRLDPRLEGHGRARALLSAGD